MLFNLMDVFSHTTVILMTQCRQIYSDSYNKMLSCTCAIFHIVLVMAVPFAVYTISILI